MNKMLKLPLALIAAGCAVAFNAGVAGAETVHANLKGFNEVPSVSTTGNARFRARIDEHAGSIFWELHYEDLQADATQAHIHLGQRHTNGGITVWLCGNPSATVNPPAGTQMCPARMADLSGTITAVNVVGPVGAQQMQPGQFEQLVRAIRAGATYANVHTTVSPGGEIRGQIRDRRKDHDHHDDDHHDHH
jgi:hypothetical protein